MIEALLISFAFGALGGLIGSSIVIPILRLAE
ncbi:Uncharacterised protein [Afipia felis]|uniref:Uncharacterized protein n=2 Tax=Afipia felis TaxID=1035 RepID=A0A380WD46_AFIFE|nr:hypothetical protein HMPREF9697_01822 [Afipia felis ATCC 53690]SUU78002.1 Uncharacterised protein [Afipia felis]SUU86067.1 Uncharacterised protein [Afipia felis]